MPIPPPLNSALPDGALRDLVLALHEIYRDAGKPSTRRISVTVRRRSDLPDTVSHEAVGMMLRGSALVRWVKLESVVRLLAEWSVSGDRDVDAVVRRFHRLWLRASDDGAVPRDVRPMPVEPSPVEPSTEPALVRPSPSQPPASAPATPTGITLGFAVLRPPPATPTSGLGPARRRAISLIERFEDFTGRDQVMQSIEDSLAEARGRPVVLIGQGGVGKTQVALEYAHRHTDAYDVVWWLPAEQPAHLGAAYRGLAGSLGVPVNRDAGRTRSAVIDRLEARLERWLLVVDNVDDAQELARIAPSGGGDVLVTTRNPEAAQNGVAVAVDVFTRAESIAYLQNRDGDLTIDQADRVAELLGDLPLALAQVAALHRATGMELSRYLEVFEGHLEELLAQGRPAHYETTLTALVNLAVARLESRPQAATLLLEVLAHLGPEPLPLSLLRAAPRGPVTPALARGLADQEHSEGLATELARHGLVTFHLAAGWVSMHRLVRACVRRSLRPEALARGRENAWAMLVAANPGNPDNARSWEMYAVIAPHVMPSGLIDATSDDARRLVVRFVRYLHQTGDYETSRVVAETARERWSGTPDARQRTLEMSRHLAIALRALARYRAARELTADALVRLRASPEYGPDHELTLKMAFSAGFDLRITGDYAAARALDEDTLARALRVYGPGHRDTFTAENNLAVSLRLLGEYAEAHRRDLDVYARRQDLYGEHDLFPWLSAINLLWDLYGLGRYGEMSQQAAQTVDDLGPLGPGHLYPLLARRAQVVAWRAGGLWSQSAHFSEEVHADHVRQLGPEHERALAMGLTRVNALRSLTRLPAARDLAVETQEGYRRLFGWRHPGTTAASIVLASVLRAWHQVDDARRIDEQAHRELAGLFGPAHPLVVCAANGLAGDLVLVGASHAAVPLLEATVDAAAVAMGPEHPVVLACRANAAIACRLSGGAERPIDVGALEGLQRVLGDGHPHTQLAVQGEWIELDVELPPS